MSGHKAGAPVEKVGHKTGAPPEEPDPAIDSRKPSAYNRQTGGSRPPVPRPVAKSSGYRKSHRHRRRRRKRVTRHVWPPMPNTVRKTEAWNRSTPLSARIMAEDNFTLLRKLEAGVDWKLKQELKKEAFLKKAARFNREHVWEQHTDEDLKQILFKFHQLTRNGKEYESAKEAILKGKVNSDFVFLVAKAQHKLGLPVTGQLDEPTFRAYEKWETTEPAIGQRFESFLANKNHYQGIYHMAMLAVLEEFPYHKTIQLPYIKSKFFRYEALVRSDEQGIPEIIGFFAIDRWGRKQYLIGPNDLAGFQREELNSGFGFLYSTLAFWRSSEETLRSFVIAKDHGFGAFMQYKLNKELAIHPLEYAAQLMGQSRLGFPPRRGRFRLKQAIRGRKKSAKTKQKSTTTTAKGQRSYLSPETRSWMDGLDSRLQRLWHKRLQDGSVHPEVIQAMERFRNKPGFGQVVKQYLRGNAYSQKHAEVTMRYARQHFDPANPVAFEMRAWKERGTHRRIADIRHLDEVIEIKTGKKVSVSASQLEYDLFQSLGAGGYDFSKLKWVFVKHGDVNKDAVIRQLRRRVRKSKRVLALLPKRDGHDLNTILAKVAEKRGVKVGRMTKAQLTANDLKEFVDVDNLPFERMIEFVDP